MSFLDLRFWVGPAEFVRRIFEHGFDGWDIILDDSPGSKAGLKAGDVIVEIDGEPVRGAIGLILTLSDKKESEITLKIVRERRDQTVNLSLRNTAP